MSDYADAVNQGLSALSSFVVGRSTLGDTLDRVAALACDTVPGANLVGLTMMKDGKPVYQSIGGLGADSIFIDAETGEAKMSEPPSVKTQFFRQAHFYFFAGSWQVALLIVFSLLACLSASTGIYLNITHWFGGRGIRQFRRF